MGGCNFVGDMPVFVGYCRVSMGKMSKRGKAKCNY